MRLKTRNQTMVDMTAETPFYSCPPIIPRDLHCTPYRHSVTRFIQVWKTSSLRERLDYQWIPHKYLLDGLRSDIPPQRIWNSHIILHSSWLCEWSFRLKLDFSLSCTGIQNCRWRHVLHHLLATQTPALLQFSYFFFLICRVYRRWSLQLWYER